MGLFLLAKSKCGWSGSTMAECTFSYLFTITCTFSSECSSKLVANSFTSSRKPDEKANPVCFSTVEGQSHSWY